MLLGEPSSDCSGEYSETETCNEGSCPIWSDWSSWGECSAYCDGGTQSRTRECLNGAEEDCSGSPTDEQECNRQSCAEPRPMIFWNNFVSFSSYTWHYVYTGLSGKGTFFEQCADYCLNKDGCNAIAVVQEDYSGSVNPPTYADADGKVYSCNINLDEFVDGPYCWGSTCYNPEDMSLTLTFGVFRDYYKANPQFLPSNEPDGTLNANYNAVKGVCDETPTAFGNVNYRRMEGNAFLTADDKNIIRESGSNCAARCFERAGCTAFYTTDDGCTFVIGYAFGVKRDPEVSEAGKIHTICPNTAFKSTFTLVSRFSCIFFAPSEADSIAEDIVEQNTGESDTPLRTWQFTTENNSPMITSSQYVSIKMLDTSGNDARYRLVGFNVETHVRVGTEGSSRRRRRSDDSDLIPVGSFTLENIKKAANKAAKKAAKEAKKAAKQLQILPRTEDILAEIAAIEQQATSFILDGNMQLPENIEVAATGPIEVVSFVQTAADGTVAADCSTGTCECSAGFIDNGNGCEQMTEEQAATTLSPTTATTLSPTTDPTTWASTTWAPTTMAQSTTAPATMAPTTTAPMTAVPTTIAPTTTKVPVDQPAEYITSLLDKLESVFEVNRPGKPRTHLMTKWKKLESKSVQRYNQMKLRGCEFADSFEFDGIDFDTVNVCLVSFFIQRRIICFGFGVKLIRSRVFLRYFGDNQFLQDIDQVAEAFVNWSFAFTSDCNKVHKEKEFQWHERNHKKINQVWARTNNRIGC